MCLYLASSLFFILEVWKLTAWELLWSFRTSRTYCGALFFVFILYWGLDGTAYIPATYLVFSSQMTHGCTVFILLTSLVIWWWFIRMIRWLDWNSGLPLWLLLGHYYTVSCTWMYGEDEERGLQCIRGSPSAVLAYNLAQTSLYYSMSLIKKYILKHGWI